METPLFIGQRVWVRRLNIAATIIRISETSDGFIYDIKTNPVRIFKNGRILTNYRLPQLIPSPFLVGQTIRVDKSKEGVIESIEPKSPDRIWYVVRFEGKESRTINSLEYEIEALTIPYLKEFQLKPEYTNPYDPAWEIKLLRNNVGRIEGSVYNVNLIFKNDKGLKGLVGLNILSGLTTFLREAPWERLNENWKIWNERDSAQLREYLEEHYGIRRFSIKDALNLAGIENRFNPAEELIGFKIKM